MSQIYLNRPSAGLPMSAEEYTARAAERLQNRSFAQGANDGAGTCQGSALSGCDCGCGGTAAFPADCGCGCGGTNPDCPADDCGQGTGCCQNMICTCRPVATTPQPPQVEEGCCCKQSFRAALSLLCDQQISSLLDFDLSAFLTCTYSAGATLEAGAGGGAGTTPGTGDAGQNPGPTTRAVVPSVTPTDNLADTLTGSFRRFSPNSYDLIDVDAPVYDADGTEIFTATQVSLCKLDAVVIQGAAATAEGDLSAEDVAARNFRCVRTRLAQKLAPCGGACGQDACSCACDNQDCCCAAGLLAALAQNNISRRVSLVAGLLVLENVTLLGTVGNVLVLANDTDNRLYFVCVNSVQFVG